MTVTPAREFPGLSEAEARTRLAADGRNALPSAPPVTWRSAIMRQLGDVVVLVLLVAGVLTAAVGDVPDTVIIAAVVVVNLALGAGQEVRSGRALDALAHLTAPHAAVVRGGVPREVPAEEVVVDDVLRLAAGDIVAADARLVMTESLQLDESLLTGESLPVTRAVGEAVSAGTVVVRGRATAVVVATGTRTALGGIARAVHDVSAGQTPLQRRLTGLGRALAGAVAVAAVAVASINLAAGRGVETSLVLAISLAVAAIPESLPAVVALALAMAARRMADRGVLVRRLAAVEALGSVTVLCVDKTGTLTEGRMAVARMWTPTDDAASRRALLEAAALCSDVGADGATSRDDPTEVALVVAAGDDGVDLAELQRRYPRIAEQPFDADLARMTTTHRTPDGHIRMICKGAPERILDGSDSDASAASSAARAFGADGLRTLAVLADDGDGWAVLGVLGLADPPRAAAADTVAAFARAGVRTVMITGDHAATARSLARRVGLTSRSVHARVAPAGKTAIVADLRRAGEIVAMTGDGVNDAAALRAADIGVAMGRRGTEVAKQAADLVLTSDDLAAMVPAIAEGRRAYDNLRRFLVYGLTGGLAEVLIMLTGPVFGFGVPLRAGQILWVNLLTHGLPGVAMGNEAAEPDVLTRPPRPPRQRLLDARLGGGIGGLGALLAAVCLAAAGWVSSVGGHWQSVLFLSLTLGQLGIGLALRPRGARPNLLLFGAVAVNVGLVALAVWWGPLRALLHTSALGARDTVVCVVASAVVTVIAAVLAPRRLPGRGGARMET